MVRTPAPPPGRRLPPLPCPECRERALKASHSGRYRIGNRRNMCDTCNNFAQNVVRLACKRLREIHAEEYVEVRLQVELDLYPQVIEDYNARVNPPQPVLDPATGLVLR